MPYKNTAMVAKLIDNPAENSLRESIIKRLSTMVKKIITVVVGLGMTIGTIPVVSANCPSYWTAEYKCMQGCGPCAGSRGAGGSSGNSNYDYGAAQRAQEAAAAAEAERQRDGEAEQQRIEADTTRRMEDVASQARFIEGRDATKLRGSNENTGELRGAGLRGSSATTELRGSTIVPVITDPMVVDGRNVPSGLPKSVDAAILTGYSSAPPGVSDRVRKGFQAVMTHDWKVARAWFEDALNHDPGNAGLQRLVALSDYTEKHVSLSRNDNVRQPPSRHGKVQLPTDSDMELLFPGWQPAPVKPASAPPRSGNGVELPKDSDMDFLFPGLPALDARELNVYMMDQAIKMTESDPVLIRLSNRIVKVKKPIQIHN